MVRCPKQNRAQCDKVRNTNTTVTESFNATM